MAAAAAALCGLASCGVQGLNFYQDDRLAVVAPEDRSTVRLPVRVVWRVEGFEVTGPDGSRDRRAGYFGLFVDRAPPAPGEDPASLVRDTEACRLDPACPGEDYLARQGIHTTTRTRFTIDRLPEPPDDDGPDRHRVTVVLLDGRSRRIGETAASVEFEVRR